MLRRRLPRLVHRLVAPPRRDLIWRNIRRGASERGFAERDLERFYHYLSVSLGVEKPSYSDEMQKPRSYFPGLDARPVHHPSAFSWVADLARDFDLVRKEVLDHSAASGLAAHPQSLTDSGKWSVLYFFDGGRPAEATTKACPRTTTILKSIPGTGSAGNTYLSVLQAGTHIKRHFGPSNTRLRCHLGFLIPEGARIRVGNEIFHWREGECLIFDDSFDHEVWNDSDKERIVLIIDFWHPELTSAERWAIAEARRMPMGLRDFSRTGSSRRTFSRAAS